MDSNRYIRALIFLSVITLTAWSLYFNIYLFGHGDHYRSLNLNYYLSKNLSAWRDYENTGHLEYSLESHLPFGIHFLTLGSVLDPILSQKIWLFLSMLLPGFFMYLFLKTVLQKHIPDIFLLSAAVFYIINPITMEAPLGLNITKFPVFLGLPLGAYFLAKFFQEESWRTKYRQAIFLALSTILTAGSYRNIAEMAPYFIILISLTAYYLFIYKVREPIKHILVLLGSAVLSILLNAWWIYSSYLNRLELRNSFIKAVASFSTQTTLADAARLFGNWGLRAGHRGLQYYSYGSFYYTLPGWILTYSISFFVAIPIISIVLKKFTNLKSINISSELKNIIIFFTLLSIIGIFLVKGASDPLGNWYRYLYDNLTYFRIFRESYSKFSFVTLFSFTVLTPISLYFFHEYLKHKSHYSKLILVMTYLLLIGSVSFPFFTGEIIRKYTNGVIKQTNTIVPDYLYELKDFSAKQNIQGRVLTLPRNGIYGNSYLWASGYTGRPAELFVDAPTIYDREVEPLNKGDLVVDLLYKFLEEYNLNSSEANKAVVTNLLRILSVSHVLLHNDLDWRNLNYPNKSDWSVEKTGELVNNLTKEGVINDAQEFGNFSKEYLSGISYITRNDPKIHTTIDDPEFETYLDELEGRPAIVLYGISPDLQLPKVYIPKSYSAYSSQEEFVELISNTPLTEPHAYIREQDFNKLNIDSNTDFPKTGLEFRKLNSSRYIVTLPEDLSENFLLIFNEEFNKGWKLYSVCDRITCREEITATHFEANLYANAWELSANPKSEFYIAYEGDNRLRLGLIISVSALLGSILLIRISKKD